MILTITNQKGGAGKTTTAAELGAALRKKGKSILFIDLDNQGNLTFAMKGNPNKPGSYEILTNKAKAPQIIQTTEQGDLLTASPALAGIESELTATGKEYRLKKALARLPQKYDFIIIDTPPALSTLTINALTASDAVLIPVQADAFGLQGIASLRETIEAVQEYCNPRLYVAGILITQYNARTNITKQMTDYLNRIAETLNTHLFNAKIRQCTAIKDAHARQMDIYAYAPRSNAAKDFDALATEFLKEAKT